MPTTATCPSAGGTPVDLPLRVGVTGHRDLVDPKVVSEQDRHGAIDQIRQVLATVKRAAEAAGAAAMPGAPPVALRVVSALADGADQVVAREGLAMGFGLTAVSPAPVAQYLTKIADRAAFQSMWDAAGPDHQYTLDGDLSADATPTKRHESYRRVGDWVLENCDLLLAVLDLDHEHKAGGAADVVEAALDRGVVVAWIEPKAGAEPRLVRGITGARFRRALAAPPGSRVLPAGCLEGLATLETAVGHFVADGEPGALAECFPGRHGDGGGGGVRHLTRELRCAVDRPHWWRAVHRCRSSARHPWRLLWASLPGPPEKGGEGHGDDGEAEDAEAPGGAAARWWRHGPVAEGEASFVAWLTHMEKRLPAWWAAVKANADAPPATRKILPDPTTVAGRIVQAFDQARRAPADLAALYKDLYLSAFIAMVALGLTAAVCGLMVLRSEAGEPAKATPPPQRQQHAAPRAEEPPAHVAAAEAPASEVESVVEHAAEHEGGGHAVNGWALAEFLAVLMILGVYAAARWLRWHERMVDLRLLAEWLRHATPLALLGEHIPHFEVPLAYARHDPSRTWVRDYFRAEVRRIRAEVGAKPDWNDPAEAEAVRTYLLENWVRSQAKYHRKNYAMADTLHEVLNVLSLVLVGLTLVCCGMHFVADWGILAVLAATLPLLVGAFHTLAAQAELRRQIDRSAALASHLHHAERKLRRLIDRDDRREAFGRWARETAKALFEEVNEWRAMFVLRPADLHI